MKLTPLAPAYYVLALSLIGLLLGFYLHRDLNSEAGGGEPIPTAKKALHCSNAVHLSGAALRFTG